MSSPASAGVFNELFSLDGVRSMSAEVAAAFAEGLPYPLLKVLEYLSLSHGAFDWGSQFRHAGDYAHALLWTGFALWCWQCVFLLFVPHHFAKLGVATGLTLLLGVLVYGTMSPSSLNIPFMSKQGTVFLSTRFGASFYLSIAAGGF